MIHVLERMHLVRNGAPSDQCVVDLDLYSTLVTDTTIEKWIMVVKPTKSDAWKRDFHNEEEARYEYALFVNHQLDVGYRYAEHILQVML
jgi:hypothetical protein